MPRLKCDNPRLLLASLRKGDYAHAGDTEAIDMVLEHIHEESKFNEASKEFNEDEKESVILNKKAIDVGCGFGGTAEYIRNHSSYELVGLDYDAYAVQHAKQQYLHIQWIVSDILQIDKVFEENKFDIIFMFNVFYNFSHPQLVLQKLSTIANKQALLAIFDYTLLKDISGMKDLVGNSMYPIILQDLPLLLQQTGWQLIKIISLSQQYEKWYDAFLQKLKENKPQLLTEFTQEVYDKVYANFALLLERIKNKEIGGGLILARYKS